MTSCKTQREYFNWESKLKFDFNGDGVLGNPFKDIDSSGNLILKKNTALSGSPLYIQIGTAAPIAVLDSKGTPIKETNAWGYTATVAETISGQNFIAFYNSSNQKLLTAKVSSTGRYSTEYAYSDESSDFYAQEKAFNYDFNGDKTVGAP